MKCQRCGKSLIRFAVEIPTKDGPIGWGPRCAAYVTIHRTRAGSGFGFTPSARARQPRRVDPMQPELPLECTP